MHLRHRAMQPGDIRECMDIIATHPIIGPRYGPMIEHLPKAWLRLLQGEARIATVVYGGEGSLACIYSYCISAIVTDDFLAELKRPPHFWIGPELARRIMADESPLLTGKQLREANSRNGLNMVCWEAPVRTEYEGDGEVQRYSMSAFMEERRGYLWKEIIGVQAVSAEQLDFLVRAGGYPWDPLLDGYTSTLRSDPSEIVCKPHILGTTRDLERKRDRWAASWVGAVFDYHPPMLGLTRSEQCLLARALPGPTDEQLAEMLGTSLPAVKKMWVSIYRRVEEFLPGLIPDLLPSDIPAAGRGREKRRHLLAYLREHPEELRPVSRVFRQNPTRMKMEAR
jgi:hypothetical protein